MTQTTHYKNEIPNNNNAEEKEPKIKYFNPASVEKDESFFAAAKTYKHKLCISMARYNESISYELTRKNNPKTADNIKRKYSKLFICCFTKVFSEIIKQKIALSKRICLAFKVNKSKINVF